MNLSHIPGKLVRMNVLTAGQDKWSKDVEMEHVIVTLLASLNPPIDWVPMGVILHNRRWGSIGPRESSSSSVAFLGCRYATPTPTEAREISLSNR